VIIVKRSIFIVADIHIQQNGGECVNGQWDLLCRYLPPLWTERILSLSTQVLDEVRELRIRAGRPLALSLGRDFVSLTVIATAEEVQSCFWRFCGRAVHAHQEELSEGFVTTEDGFRVGVAGRAVVKDGKTVSYRDITSLCVRVSRPMIACASPLLPFLEKDGTIQSLLVCGTPSCGKTTVLRDAARLLSERYNVAVVDERRELAAKALGGCDVLSGCPKAVGILQAVRTLSPDVVIADELGGDEEWRAVAASCYLGVPVIASVHACHTGDLTARPTITRTIGNGGFSLVAMMPPRHRTEDATKIWKAGDLLENRGDRADRVYLCGDRHCGGMAIEGQRGGVESVGAVASPSARRASLYGGAV